MEMLLTPNQKAYVQAVQQMSKKKPQKRMKPPKVFNKFVL